MDEPIVNNTIDETPVVNPASTETVPVQTPVQDAAVVDQKPVETTTDTNPFTSSYLS